MAIVILDVDYGAAGSMGATAACVVAERWTDAVPIETLAIPIPKVLPYTPGRFFERELPCLTAVIPRVVAPIDVLVIDGYVVLDAAGKPGLGAHLHAHYGGRHPVVGIAKSPYGDAGFATAVVRGGSKVPLFVTALGIDVEEAARQVAAMHGKHRLPTLVGWVDRLAAGDPPPWPTR
jgi:deoxyribonuclease V